MASNESPIGTSPEVAVAVSAALSGVHRYPDPLADELRKELASQHGVHPDQILVGNGSDELIYLLAWAFLAHGGRAVCADPPYRIDEISTFVVDARLNKVPLKDWAHDLDAMSQVEADVAYIVNPHNPTGTAHSRAEIEGFVELSRAALVVVDEAYIDFTDDPEQTTVMPLAREGDVVVLRTLSKVYALAGLRVGYMVASRDVVTTLRKIRPPFSVGALAQAAALAAVRDNAHRQRVRDHVLRLRGEVTCLVQQAGYLAVPSQANFVLVEVPDELAFVAHLASHGIEVRPGSVLGLPGTVRISVPSDSGLALLRRALSSKPGKAR
ncbi:MAG: pyridoxal phosphate-dependent aminotransferase [Acidimicrobiales bacterium]